MILEVAVLDVKHGQTEAFEVAFRQAAALICTQRGCTGYNLQRCLENPSRYVLLVNWETLEDHTVGFRQSAEYQEWKRLLHPFYDPSPTVEHYKSVVGQAIA